MIRTQRAMMFALFVVLMIALAACGGSVSAPAGNTPAPTSPAPTIAPTQPPSKPSPTTVAQAPLPKACALLTVGDVEKLSGYSGGAATPNDLGGGQSSCHIITGKGTLTVEVDVGAGAMPLLPGERIVNLEGGARGKVSTQSLIGQDWMMKIDFPNYSVFMVLGGSAAKLDPDKKIADVTRADGSKMTFGQVYEAFARAIAHNAASGAQNPSGVVQLGDPCTALTLADVKQLLPDFDVTGPDYQDTTFGGKQCIYRFRSSALQAAGFATLAFITQPKFDADMKNRDPLSGVGDAAGITGGMVLDFLDFKKGANFVYMTFGLDSNNSSSLEKLLPLRREGLKQLAQKAAARIK